MKSIFAFALTVLLLGVSTSAQTRARSRSQSIVLIHVTVIDMTGAPPKSNLTVIIKDGLISALGTTGKVRVPKGAAVIDGTGRFLIPGLWDMHVHLSIAGKAAS